MSSAAAEKMSVFGPTLRFKGELKAQEDLKVEGRIEGTIQHQQRVVVGAKGEVIATVSAAAIDVDPVEHRLHYLEDPRARLVIEIAIGGIVYAGSLWFLFRDRVLALVRATSQLRGDAATPATT